MAMVVKNNMSALNTLNVLNKNTTALSASLQKVSSGMKINSAADDASGYAISERMRVQIRSLDQAKANTQNGSSMMKVAEGAVSSTVEILKTLKEKAINAANDSNTDADRQTIQKELNQSIDQINDNANVTFNGKYLVDGSKNNKGQATFTALTNQSLDKSTNSATKLVELKSRTGESLELTNTDKITVSYVQNGKTHTAHLDITDETTLGDIFKAAEDQDTSSQIFADINNASVQKAMGLSDADIAAIATKKADSEAELTTAKNNVTDAGRGTAKKIAYDNAKAADDAAKEVLGKLNTGDNSKSTGAVKAAYDAVQAWNEVAGATGKIATSNFATDAKTTAANLKTAAANATVTGDPAYTSEAGIALKKAVDALTAASDAVYTASTGTEAVLTTATNAYNDAAKIQYTEDQAALQEAQAEYDKYHGTALLNGANVGVGTAGDVVATASGDNAITVTANNAGIQGQISGFNISVSDAQGNVKKSANASLDAWEETVRAQNTSEDNAISLQVGAKASQSIKFGLTDMRAEALGLQGADGAKLNISTQDKANAAINVLENAIQKALDQQTTIGSVESRLEYTASNLTTASENVTASESTIRDADMAKEMTEYTKNNVLMQAAQSMLAQANQNSSNVLSLLQ